MNHLISLMSMHYMRQRRRINMKDIPLVPATNFIKPLKIFLFGPTYSGKTYNAITMAVGVVMELRQCTEEEAYKHIILIDSEYGRGALLKQERGPYNYYRIDPPYWPDKLVDALNILNEKEQIDVIICDSLTHYWSKRGGILDQKAQQDKQGGNSYTNWIEYTGIFNRLIDAILQSSKHIIATARAKTDTVLEKNDKGKYVPITYGTKPELREGIEYDFDISFNVESKTHALIRDKGVPGMKPYYPAPTYALGAELITLFNTDKEVLPRTTEDVIQSLRYLAKEHNLVPFMMLELNGRKIDTLDLTELSAIEEKLIREVEAQQNKKGKNS